MAYADPQTVTINAIANTLNRVSSDKAAGTFQKDDSTVVLKVSHDVQASKVRHLARIDHTKIAADPLLAGVNVKKTTGVYLVIDAPSVGYTNAELKQVVDGFITWLSGSSGANIVKLLGNEN